MPGSVEDLFHLEPDQLSAADLQDLVDQQINEGFRLEYKRELGDGDKTLAGICAMANTFGGVLVVGMDEERDGKRQGFGSPGPEGLVGVDPAERARLASFCSNRLVPPYDPEIVAVDLGNKKVALVVRVDHEVSPLPVAFGDRVLVRTEAGNRSADLFRLRDLFLEGTADSIGVPTWTTTMPHNAAPFHESFPADLIVRSVGVTRLATGATRPLLGDKVRNHLRGVLWDASLAKWLMGVHGQLTGASGNINSWITEGLNTSTRVELRWQGIVSNDRFSPEARIVLELQKPQGGSPPSFLQTTVDVILRNKMASTFTGQESIWKIDLESLFLLFKALLQTFAGAIPSVLELLPVAVGPMIGPSVGVLTSSTLQVSDAIETDRLRVVPPNTSGNGAELFRHPFLNLGDPDQRHEQAGEWLRELLLDCHFVGVDTVVDEIVA